MPSGIIQRQKTCSSKACLEATGIRHLWRGDDSPALEKKTTGEIIPSIQMNPGIEPSNVPLNTSLLWTHGIKAAARADTGHVYSSVKTSCAKQHKCFLCILPGFGLCGSFAVNPWDCFRACAWHQGVTLSIHGLLWSQTWWEPWFHRA